VLWSWIAVDGLDATFALRLDGLSLTMMGVITGVGFLIHIFASWYMRGDDGYERFFSYMNLFIASMLFLVLGDNFLFLYMGWEGVGLASYLLIGFYYKDPANGLAARKAFIVTRVGDTLMAIGLMIIFRELGTLNIQEVMRLAPQYIGDGDTWIIWATLLLLGGAVGKSAQLPLQTWLADAMAGPTPVSALIHAATMVTAGRHHRRSYSRVGWLCRLGANRYQAHLGLFHHEPNRLYVPRSRRRCLVGRDLPPDDPCLLQSTAIPLGRCCDHCHASRAKHFQDGRFAPQNPLCLCLLLGRRCRTCRLAAGDFRLLFKG
jgi:hypothetical protein